MLRTDRDGGEAWFVTQPDHAEVAGYLAAHWGGNGAFARPGHYAPVPDPEALRAAAVLGIALHDNGWWEWDAAPGLAPADGLPLGLREVIKDQAEGMRRWQLGVPRFKDRHPYAALLTSGHAYWLHAPRVGQGDDPAFRHPLYGGKAPARLEGADAQATRDFLAEIAALRAELTGRMAADPACAGWLDPAQLDPHVRLLQLTDALSLSLCSAVIPPLDGGPPRGLGEDPFDFLDVPRQGWHDRVTVRVRPTGEPGRIACDPYPFDQDPLPVAVRVRRFEAGPAGRPAGEPFASRWHGTSPELLRFSYVSAG